MAKPSRRLQARDAKRSGAPDPRFIQEDIGTPYVEPKSMPQLHAANDNQRIALQMLEQDRKVVFLRGSAGTGKSMLGCYRAAKLLRSKKIDKIYLVRPAVAVGKSVGLLPGELDEKLSPYFAQVRTHLETFLGKGFTQYCFDKGVIEMKAVEYMRGASLENCFLLIDESQNLTSEEFEMMLTRIGKNCQVVFTGDERQNDLQKQGSGLTKTIDKLLHVQATEPRYMTDDDLEELDSNLGIVTFTPDDVVRSGLCKAFVRMFYHA